MTILHFKKESVILADLLLKYSSSFAPVVTVLLVVFMFFSAYNIRQESTLHPQKLLLHYLHLPQICLPDLEGTQRRKACGAMDFISVTLSLIVTIISEKNNSFVPHDQNTTSCSIRRCPRLLFLPLPLLNLLLLLFSFLLLSLLLPSWLRAFKLCCCCGR